MGYAMSPSDLVAQIAGGVAQWVGVCCRASICGFTVGGAPVSPFRTDAERGTAPSPVTGCTLESCGEVESGVISDYMVMNSSKEPSPETA